MRGSCWVMLAQLRSLCARRYFLAVFACFFLFGGIFSPSSSASLLLRGAWPTRAPHPRRRNEVHHLSADSILDVPVAYSFFFPFSPWYTGTDKPGYSPPASFFNTPCAANTTTAPPAPFISSAPGPAGNTTTAPPAPFFSAAGPASNIN